VEDSAAGGHSLPAAGSGQEQAHQQHGTGAENEAAVESRIGQGVGASDGGGGCRRHGALGGTGGNYGAGLCADCGAEARGVDACGVVSPWWEC
jgi:hypothetical protein